MNEGVLRGLSRVLRLELAAIQQHFIHVLLLRAWADAGRFAGGHGPVRNRPPY